MAIWGRRYDIYKATVNMICSVDKCGTKPLVIELKERSEWDGSVYPFGRGRIGTLRSGWLIVPPTRRSSTVYHDHIVLCPKHAKFWQIFEEAKKIDPTVKNPFEADDIEAIGLYSKE